MSVKMLMLHPLMTMSLIGLQFQKLLHCNVTVYILHNPAAAFQTLKEAGYCGMGLLEFPIDETMSLREFEEELAERFHLEIELSDGQQKPFSAKSIKLYQLSNQTNQGNDPNGMDRLADRPGNAAGNEGYEKTGT